MAAAGYTISRLGKRHDRAAFSCGEESLDGYLRLHAGQDARRKAASVYVLTEADSDQILGYYTLSATAIEAGELPAELAKKLPKYEALPGTLIGRLAVDLSARGKGYGGVLLDDALERAWVASDEVGSVAVVVEALNETAVAFYEHHGLKRFPDNSWRLFIPMAVLKKHFS